MSAAVLLVGFILFGVYLTFHVVIWRMGRLRSDVRALFVIFLIVPGLVGVALLGAAPFAPEGPIPSGLDVAAVLLLHWALASTHVLTYPAAQAQSPSLEIVYAVGQSIPRGLSREEILPLLNSETLVDRFVNASRAFYVVACLIRTWRLVLGFEQVKAPRSST
jgi:hypothetical protein